MAQYGVPNGDVSASGWNGNPGGGNLWDKINDGINGGTPDDSTYINNATDTNTCEINLESLSDPDSGDHILRVRARSNENSSTTVTIYLFQSGPSSVITSSGLTCPAPDFFPPGPIAEGTILLTAGEVSNITDYSDLRVGFSQNGSFGGSQVTEVEFEIPDATAGGGGGPKLNPEFFIMCL
jgi:hypothetical protein